MPAREAFDIEPRLRNLFNMQGTDKECYAPTYETLLRDRRDEIRRILEIGIGTLIPDAWSSMHGYVPDHYRPGGSLRAWRSYFPNAEIIGIDVQADTQFSDERIGTFLCDSTDARAVAALLSSDLSNISFDVIIDDGSHDTKDQLATLKNFFPALARSGFYFIEDIAEGSVLYENPRVVEPVIGLSPYFAISDGDPISGEKWKMIVIRKLFASCSDFPTSSSVT